MAKVRGALGHSDDRGSGRYLAGAESSGDGAMTAVWKYTLPNGPAVASLQMPKGAQILRIEAQHNIPTMWVLVDSLMPNEARMFEGVMTGQQFTPGGMDYVGTCQLHGGGFVMHFWEVRKK